MNTSAWIQLIAFLVVLLALSWPLARWIFAAMEGRIEWLRRVERGVLKLAGVNADAEQGWLRYSLGLLIFNGLGVLAVYALQRLQQYLPLNPQGFGEVTPDSAFNTAVSFVTNTNWQGYGGETTMSYLTQMLALTVQNFFSAATGIAVVIALLRGFARHSGKSIGNVWTDLTRATLWVLLPLSFVFAIVLAGMGVVQTFKPYQDVTTIEAQSWQEPKLDQAGQPLKGADGQPVMEDKSGQTQSIAVGPVASQLAIKMLGTNGGGFFNANSAHPFENPTAATNALQMLSIFLNPAALCFVMGRQVGDMRQGWALLGAMTAMFVVGVVVATGAEQGGNPHFTKLGVDAVVSATQSGGNMEGKEVRFGIEASSLFAVITTSASCGAINAWHDSFTPLGGAVPMVMMQLGEVVFGGVGAGLYGMLVFAILSVFIAGLMIGRTPEYLGKKIEAHEMKMVSLAILLTPLAVLIGTAIAVVMEPGKAGIAAPGAHGFSEVLYAFSSAGNNNGSAFGGLSVNTPFYNLLLGLVMWIGRFGVIVPVLAMAGSLVGKKRLAPGEGTLPTHGPLFVVLLIGAVLLVGLLNYVPALALGPVVDHLILWECGMSRQSLTRKGFSLLDPALTRAALVDAFRKLDPRTQLRNPVMFVVYLGSLLTTALAHAQPSGFVIAVTVWLWFTVLFANFAEALAEGRSKAQAASLRGLKKETWAKVVEGWKPGMGREGLKWHPREASTLRKGEVVFIETNDVVPADAEVVEGVASVDESAITGESAPVIRESGGDFLRADGRHPRVVRLGRRACRCEPRRDRLWTA